MKNIRSKQHNAIHKRFLWIAAAVLMCAFICGCAQVSAVVDTLMDKISGGKISEKINAITGLWSVDAMIVDGRRLTADELNSMLGQTYYEFRADKVLVINSPKKPQVGTWKPDGDAYELTIDNKTIGFAPENGRILLVNGGTFIELVKDDYSFPEPQLDTQNTIKPDQTAEPTETPLNDGAQVSEQPSNGDGNYSADGQQAAAQLAEAMQV